MTNVVKGMRQSVKYIDQLKSPQVNVLFKQNNTVEHLLVIYRLKLVRNVDIINKNMWLILLIFPPQCIRNINDGNYSKLAHFSWHWLGLY